MDFRRRLEQLTLASLPAECPPVEQLADYLLGLLSDTEQLRVAAHVRACPICTHELEVCQPPPPRPRRQIARLVPTMLSADRRAEMERAEVRQYVAADLEIHLTVAPAEGDHWQITGHLTQASASLGTCPVVLRKGRRHYQQTSDADGFFAFEQIPSGSYTLTVTYAQTQVQIRNLEFKHSDE